MGEGVSGQNEVFTVSESTTLPLPLPAFSIVKWELVEVGWISQIYRDFLYKLKCIYFSISDLGKIIDLDLNCLRKAINWPRSSLGRVLLFECRTNGIVQWHEIDRADRQTHDICKSKQSTLIKNNIDQLDNTWQTTQQHCPAV